MKVIIDRFEGDFAVVETDTGTFVNMPRILVPDAHEGDVIEICVDRDATGKRSERIAQLKNSLFEDD